MLNSVNIQGRFVAKPELRYTKNNTPVSAFTLAVEDDFAKSDGTRGTQFIDCVAWRQTAEFVSKNFKKGNMALVRGSIILLSQ